MKTNMKTKTEEFEVLIPNLDGTDIAERVKVPVTLEWDEEVKQWLLTPEAHQIIEDTKARRIGLLLPAQLKELRERYDYTQKEMGELFQVGEKSWTRWESGRHRPSRSINLLIRALYEGQISINYLLRRAGKPIRMDEEVAETEKYTNWLLSAMVSNAFATNYFAEGVQVIHCHTKAHVKSAFLKTLSNMAFQQSMYQGVQIKSREGSGNQLLDKSNRRFDYEKINLA